MGVRTWTSKSILKDWLTPALIVALISAVIGGAWKLQRVVTTHIVEDRQLQFESVEQKVKVVGWAESDYNQVSVYEQGKKIDTALVKIEKLIEDKKEDKERIDKSRASRDSSQRTQAQAMKSMDSTNVVQTQTLQLILKLLDTIKN